MKRFTLHHQPEGTMVLEQNVPLKNHINQPFPAFPKSIAERLCKDLNEIATAGKKSLTESFIYCVLSTFLSDGATPYKAPLKLETCLQWDQAYRLAPGPPHSIYQYQSILPLVNFLNDEWRNLPLNYCSTFTQMVAEDVPMVSPAIVNKMQLIYNDCNEIEQFAVILLFEFYQRISISMPLLWVAKKMNSADLQSHAIPFQNDKIKPRLSPKQKLEMAFMQMRLSNFRQFLSDKEKEKILMLH